jgi:diguanylate cyclase (GGDEF)-like protein/PAS domain S-box-containing protein
LRLALDVGNTGLWDIDFDSGRIRYSDSGLALFGYRPDQITPTMAGWLSLVHSADIPTLNAAFDAHLAGETPRFKAEYRLRDADGHWHWVLDRGQVISRFGDGSPRRAIGCYVDITERRQMEERLRASLAALAEAQTIGHVGSWTVDVESGALDCSAETYRIFGFQPGALLTAKDFAQHLHPDDQATLRQCWTDMLGGQRIVQAVRLNTGHDLRWIEVHMQARFDWRGKPTLAVGTVQDITDLRNAQMMLEVQRELARALAAGSDRAEVLRVILDSALRVDHLDGGGIYWRAANGDYDLVHHRGFSETFVKTVAHLPADSAQADLIRVGRIACSCSKLGPQCTHPDLITHAPLQAEGLRSLAVLPVMVDGEALACLNLGSWRSPTISPESLQQLESFALQFGETLQRQQAIEDARHQRENLQGLFDRLADFLFILDGSGCIRHVNRVVYDRLGYSPDQLLGKPVLEMHPPEIRADAARIVSEMLAGTRGACPLPLQRADGGLIMVETNVVAGIWDGQPALFGISRDISERIAAESHQRLAVSVFDGAEEGIVITDAAATIVDVNPAFTDITGYSRAEVIGQRPSILKSGHHGAEFYQTMWQTLQATGRWRGEVLNRTKSGEFYAEQLSITAVRGDDGLTAHYVGMFSDVTVAKEQQRRLERLAHYDSLTQLPNRTLLTDRLDQAMAQARREAYLLAVCCLDLDGFKPVNDQFGHDAGDHLLREVAQRLRDCVRGIDTVARLGGDEFVLLLGNLESVIECEHALDRTLATLARPFLIEGKEIRISGSLGVALYPSDDVDAETLLRHADLAMYEAKQGGRNRYALFDAEQDKHLREHRTALTRLRQAMQDHEFELFYQPKVDMRRGVVLGVEALIRWRHPERGVVLPAEFLPTVNQSDLVVELGRWVMVQAISQAADWFAAGHPLNIGINIAGPHLVEPNFSTYLAQILASHPELPPHLIELDVLETTAMDDMQQIEQVIRACQQLGVGFALDDFGTGYSSLTYFRHLPVNTLKIDQSFVRDMLEDGDDMAIVEGIVGISKAFRRQIVAEGVESVEHGLILLQMGCDRAQGFGIARPMPAPDVLPWLIDYRPDPLWQASSAFRWRREDLPLLAAELELKRWRDAVLGDPAARQQAAKVCVGDCSIGRWLGGKGRQQYATLDGFAPLDSLHHQLHAAAARLASEPTVANAECADFHRLCDDFLEQLHLLQAEVLTTPPQRATPRLQFDPLPHLR